MTGDAFRAALEELDVTQAGWAKLVGVDERTVRRVIAGQRDLSGPEELLLQLLLQHRIGVGTLLMIRFGKKVKPEDLRDRRKS